MTHPSLLLLGYSEAAMFLSRTPKPSVAAIISIHGRREFGVEAEAEHRLDLTFDDVEIPDKSDLVSLYHAISQKHRAEQDGLVEVAPTQGDAVAIIRFAESVRNVNGQILCHCGGGMSRAPAAGLISLATWTGPGAEADCMAEILGLRCGAVPHIGLVRLADELLGRNGALVKAVLAAR